MAWMMTPIASKSGYAVPGVVTGNLSRRRQLRSGRSDRTRGVYVTLEASVTQTLHRPCHGGGPGGGNVGAHTALIMDRRSRVIAVSDVTRALQ